MSEMTYEEIRLAIAKVKGCKFFVIRDENKWVYPAKNKSDLYPGNVWIEVDKDRAVPAYLVWERDDEPTLPLWSTEIAAAFSLEDEIPEGERGQYVHLLWSIVTEDKHPIVGIELWWLLAHATPRQRCLAYLAYKESGK